RCIIRSLSSCAEKFGTCADAATVKVIVASCDVWRTSSFGLRLPETTLRGKNVNLAGGVLESSWTMGTMSALGQKPTYAVQKSMSALPPKADMCSALAHVCYGPEGDIGVSSVKRKSPEHLPRVK